MGGVGGRAEGVFQFECRQSVFQDSPSGKLFHNMNAVNIYLSFLYPLLPFQKQGNCPRGQIFTHSIHKVYYGQGECKHPCSAIQLSLKITSL